MAVRSVITLGYGSGGSVGLIITLGYAGAVVTTTGKSITKAGVIRDDLANWDGVTKTVSRIDETGGKVFSLAVGDYVDVLQVFGKAYTVATISSALKFIGENRATLRWSAGLWRIDSDVTIPDNFANHVTGGCVFEIADGKTLTFEGPVNVEYSAKWYTGTVVCNLGASGFPGW